VTPREQIEALKAALSVPEYFRLTNHRLHKIGRQFAVLCPFHNEKTPSCYLYEDHFYCFGCTTYGDVIDAHKRIQGVNFTRALEELCRMAGINHNLTPRTSGRSVRINIPRRESE